MSFGAEFRNMRAAGGAPKVTEEASKEAETVAASKAAEDPPQDSIEEAVFAQPFVDGQTLGETAPNSEGLPPVIPPPKIETKKPVRINGKNFDSVEEAMEYAAELERTIEKDEAYRKGLEAAQPKPEVAPAPKRMKKIADKLFENPDEAMDDLEAYTLELVDKTIAEREARKQAEETQVQTVKQTWDNFYKTNSDLSAWQQEVNLVTQREWHRLQHMPAQEGLEEIARLAREYVGSVKERALPKSTLNSRPAHTAPSGVRSATTTIPQTTEKKLSFAEQVRSTNKRTAMQSET